MSAVYDTLKQEALEREESGFTTMRPKPAGFLPGLGDTWTTVNRTMVGSGTAVVSGSYVIAYDDQKTVRGSTVWDWEGADARRPGIVRSDNFLVLLDLNASTMDVGEVVVVDFSGSTERGVISLKMPRKTIKSFSVSFQIAQLKRKTPRVILGGRTNGEEHA